VPLAPNEISSLPSTVLILSILLHKVTNSILPEMPLADPRHPMLLDFKKMLCWLSHPSQLSRRCPAGYLIPASCQEDALLVISSQPAVKKMPCWLSHPSQLWECWPSY